MILILEKKSKLESNITITITIILFFSNKWVTIERKLRISHQRSRKKAFGSSRLLWQTQYCAFQGLFAMPARKLEKFPHSIEISADFGRAYTDFQNIHTYQCRLPRNLYAASTKCNAHEFLMCIRPFAHNHAYPHITAIHTCVH